MRNVISAPKRKTNMSDSTLDTWNIKAYVNGQEFTPPPSPSCS